MQSPTTNAVQELINPPSNPLSVHLYEVTTAVVDTGAKLDRITTNWDKTKLLVDLSINPWNEEQDFTIAGFRHSNIMFLTEDKGHFKRQSDIFRRQLSHLSQFTVLVCVI